jgi:arylsulfatase
MDAMNNNSISRRDYMKIMSAAGLAAGALVNAGESVAMAVSKEAPADRKDILVFMVDQLGAKWLEAASKMGLTPHYDRLKARGTTFTRCITSNPVCTPARSTMITGMTTRQHGVLQNGYALDPGLPNYVRILKAHGYRTAGFGKFHFFPHHVKWDAELSEYGFDLWKQTQDPNKREFVAKGETTGKGYFFGFKDKTATQTEWISRHALNYLQKPPADGPLYTFVSYVQPHSPFCPPASCLPRVDASKLPKPIKRTWPDDPLHPVSFDKKPCRGDEAFWMKARHHYFADIAHLDDQLGKMTDALKKTKRIDNTFIIFTADHGEMLGDHGLSSKANQHYDAVIRIPLTIAGPGLKGGLYRV